MDFSFSQGTDKKISLLILEAGVALPLTGAISIKAVLYVGNVQQKIYSMQPSVGSGKLDVDSLVTNQVNFYIERIDSKNFPVGPMKVVVLVATTDSQFPDGDNTRAYTFNPGNVLRGDALDVTFP